MCIRDSPEAAPLKPEAKNISIKTFICPKPDEIDPGIISLKILFSSSLTENQADLNLNNPILWISQHRTANCMKVPVKVAMASNPEWNNKLEVVF